MANPFHRLPAQGILRSRISVPILRPWSISFRNARRPIRCRRMSRMKPVSVDATTAECLVFTRKAGLLAAVGHDLKLRVERFEVAIDDQGIRARFDAASFRVVCAQVDGKDAPGALSQRDRGEIEKTIAREVLEARKHAAIEFRSGPVAVS